MTNISKKLSSKEVAEIVDYWVVTGAHDYESFKHLYLGKQYSNALFFGHIILEKILKAHVAKNIENHPPYSHNLIHLAKLTSNLNLSQDELRLLAEVNDFNIRCRYPEDKFVFYKKCTPEFSEKYYFKIDQLYQNLCLALKPKK